MLKRRNRFKAYLVRKRVKAIGDIAYVFNNTGHRSNRSISIKTINILLNIRRRSKNKNTVKHSLVK